MTKEELDLQKLEYIRQYRGVDLMFTQDRAQIEQFMHLYDHLNKTDPRFAGFRYFCDDDINNYIGDGHYMQLLMKDGRCIGGGRLTHRPKGQNFLLPLEMDIADETHDTKYLLKNMMPKIDVEGGCAEVSRLVLAPEYRGDATFSGAMFLNFCVRWLDTEGDYLFILADRVRTRMYCQLVKRFTQLEGHIFKNLLLPDQTDFEGLKMQILGWDKYNKLKDIYGKN
jgi:hypothetical protein